VARRAARGQIAETGQVFPVRHDGREQDASERFRLIYIVLR
jgi:hypothetical protein